MTTFAANMKSFTADVAAANLDRADALKSVHRQTKHVLADARTFVKDAARHHRSVAKEVRSTLTHERKARVKQVGHLKDQIHRRWNSCKARCRKPYSSVPALAGNIWITSSRVSATSAPA